MADRSHLNAYAALPADAVIPGVECGGVIYPAVLDVGVDLDGVLYYFKSSWCQYVVDAGLVPADQVSTEEGAAYAFYEDHGFTAEQFWQQCHDGVDAGVIFRVGEPRPGAVDAIARLKAAGHRIHIKTARHFGAEGASERNTREWLAEHGIEFDTLTMTTDKTAGPRCDVFIEDSVANYDALVAAGVRAALVNVPWNEPHDDGRARVADVGEFATAVLALADEIAWQRDHAAIEAALPDPTVRILANRAERRQQARQRRKEARATARAAQEHVARQRERQARAAMRAADAAPAYDDAIAASTLAPTDPLVASGWVAVDGADPRHVSRSLADLRSLKADIDGDQVEGVGA